MRCVSLLAILLIACAAALGDETAGTDTALPGPAAAVRTVDGRTVRGAIERIDAERVVVKNGGKTETVARADILAIDLAEKPPENPADAAGRHILVLHDGSRLAIAEYAIAEGKLTAENELVGTVTVPLDRVACVLRARPDERAADVERQYEALRIPGDAKDHVVMAKRTGPWVPVAGIIKSVDAKAILFSYEGTEALLESDTIPVIQFARVKLDLARAAGHLVGADGNRLVFASLEWADGRLGVTSPALGAVSVEGRRLAAIRFLNDRLVYLSDLEPVEVREAGFFGSALGWRKDRAVGGQPLRLGGVTYEKGLGLHSRAELVFDIRGQYRRLAAIAGIDEDARFGTAWLTVTGDGKALLEKTRLARQDPPKPLQLDVAGVKRLAILVDFGEGTFGVGERVDLADAKLIK